MEVVKITNGVLCTQSPTCRPDSVRGKIAWASGEEGVRCRTEEENLQGNIKYGINVRGSWPRLPVAQLDGLG